MLKDHIGLRNELTKVVEIYIAEEKIGTGELILRKNCLPRVDVSGHPTNERSNIKSIQLSLHDQPTFTLLDCELYSNIVYPKAVIKSKNHNGEFKKITIILDGFSTWMNNGKTSKITDTKVTHYRPTNKFCVIVNDPALGQLKIQCDNWTEFSTCETNSIRTIQHTPITIEKKSQYFNCDNVIDITNKIRNILSLIIGYNLTISYCFDSSNKTLCSVYFPSVQDKSPQFEHPRQCLANATYITRKNLWESLFKNVFEKNANNRFDLWSRLAGLKGLSKYWEQEILACVAMLDEYTKKFSEPTELKIPTSELKRLKIALKKTVSDFEFSDKIDEITSCIKEQITEIRNTNRHSFEQRFDFTYNSTNKLLKKITNLTEMDFKHIKQIRNKIAHGDTPKTKKGIDITYETTIQAKIMVALYYWAFQDLGFSDKECIDFISNWQHPTIRAAKLDKTALDRALKRHKFIRLNDIDYSIAKEVKSEICIEYVHLNKEYRYDAGLSSKTKVWHRSNIPDQPKWIEEYITNHVQTDKITTVTYIGAAYIENESEAHQTYGVCILNPPKHLIDKNRTWTYNHADEKWHTNSKFVKRTVVQPGLGSDP